MVSQHAGWVLGMWVLQLAFGEGCPDTELSTSNLSISRMFHCITEHLPISYSLGCLCPVCSQAAKE